MRPMNPNAVLWPEINESLVTIRPEPDIRRLPPSPPPAPRVKRPRSERPVTVLNRKEGG